MTKNVGDKINRVDFLLESFVLSHLFSGSCSKYALLQGVERSGGVCVGFRFGKRAHTEVPVIYTSQEVKDSGHGHLLSHMPFPHGDIHHLDWGW